MISNLLKNVLRFAEPAKAGAKKRPLLQRVAARVMAPIARISRLMRSGRKAGQDFGLAATREREKGSALVAAAVEPLGELRPQIVTQKESGTTAPLQQQLAVERAENEGGLVVDDDFEPVVTAASEAAPRFARFVARLNGVERLPKVSRGVISAHTFVERGYQAAQRFAGTARRGAGSVEIHRRDGI